jgi:hypothetical protein
MAPRRRRATFNDDLPRRIRFEKEAREVGLEFTGGFSGTPRLLRYRVPITVPIYDEPRNLAITLGPVAEPGAIPDVLIDGPVCLRHRFDGGGLCMWWNKDSNGQRWVPDDGLYALVAHAIDHSYCEARCQRGHPWPKPEAPRRHREGCPTCRLQR